MNENLMKVAKALKAMRVIPELEVGQFEAITGIQKALAIVWPNASISVDYSKRVLIIRKDDSAAKLWANDNTLARELTGRENLLVKIWSEATSVLENHAADLLVAALTE